jgi:hypothetical protein
LAFRSLVETRGLFDSIIFDDEVLRLETIDHLAP